MVAFTSIIATSAALVGLTYAAPSNIPFTGVIHRIYAGSTTANNGLHYEPENVVANIGDLIEFHFLPKNHTIVQSSFDKPCEPLRDASGAVTGKFAGFNFNTTAGESKSVFTFQVRKTRVHTLCSGYLLTSLRLRTLTPSGIIVPRRR